MRIEQEALEVVKNYETARRTYLINSAVDYAIRVVDKKIPIEQIKDDIEETAHVMQMGDDEFQEFVNVVSTSIVDYSAMLHGPHYEVKFQNDEQ